MIIGKMFGFEAAHQLTGWPADHKCRRLHGHSYKVLVEVYGPIPVFSDPPGCVIDFAELSDWWKNTIFATFDHQSLNDVMVGAEPTAENLAAYIAEVFKGWKFTRPIRLLRVRVWETADSYAEYQA